MEKDRQALEQKRKDVADLRNIWITKRQPLMANHLERLAFIDEPSVKTNMARTTGWAPRGQRLVDQAPFGHWPTQTFIGALRHDRLDAPRVIDGAMNGEMFDRHVATQLVQHCGQAMSSSSTTCPATRTPVRPKPCARSAQGSCFCRPTVPCSVLASCGSDSG